MQDLTPKYKIIPSKHKIQVPDIELAQAFGGFRVGTGGMDFGGLRIQSTEQRILLGNATGPMTGVGIFLGLDDPDYEFRAGNPSGDYIHWNGTILALRGSITVTGGDA